MQRIIVALALILVALSVWQLNLAQEREDRLNDKVAALGEEVAQLKGQIGTLEAQVADLNETSVQGMVNEANDAILQGWESLVHTVEDELKKAREAMDESMENLQESNPKEPPAPDAKPKLESHDGTDRT